MAAKSKIEAGETSVTNAREDEGGVYMQGFIAGYRLGTERLEAVEDSRGELLDELHRIGAAAEDIYAVPGYRWTVGEAIGHLLIDASRWKAERNEAQAALKHLAEQNHGDSCAAVLDNVAALKKRVRDYQQRLAAEPGLVKAKEVAAVLAAILDDEKRREAIIATIPSMEELDAIAKGGT